LIADKRQLDQILWAAMRFRVGILKSHGAGLISFEEFPKGSCGDAVLLGQYLADCEFGDWEYVDGERPRDQFSHAWIEQPQILVDITLDQFGDEHRPVVVRHDKRWHHREFPTHGPPRHLARIDVYDAVTQRRLATAYARISALGGDGNHQGALQSP
jgi:hypothetical protein